MCTPSIGHRYNRRSGLLATGTCGAIAVAALAITDMAQAQVQSQQCNAGCNIQITDHTVQPVPSKFKFQARISQAKMPVGNQVFNTVIVNIKDGGTPKCQETFSNVAVRESVLNLEIGSSATCALDQIVAESNNLLFQVCLGSQDNCLSPITLSSVPYAMKATYASQAQEAFQSQQAAQAGYAHRVTADTDMFATYQIGRGYYEFATPIAGNLSGVGISDPSGGFIQWSTVLPTDNNLTVVGRDHNSGILRSLYNYRVAAGQSTFMGNLTVDNNGNLIVTGNTEARQKLDVYGVFTAHGNSEFLANVHHAAGTMTTFDGSLTSSTLAVATFNGSVFLNGATTATNTFTTTAASNSTFNGPVTLNAATTATNTFTTTAASNSTFNGPVTLTNTNNVTGSLAVAGAFSVPTGTGARTTTFSGPTILNGTNTVNGNTTFAGTATHTGATAINGGLTTSSTSASTFNGTTSFVGNSTHTGTTAINGGLTTSSTSAATFNGTTSFVGAATHTGATAINGGLTTSSGSTATFSGPTNLNGATTIGTGAVSVSGAMSIPSGSGTRTTTFSGPVVFSNTVSGLPTTTTSLTATGTISAAGFTTTGNINGSNITASTSLSAATITTNSLTSPMINSTSQITGVNIIASGSIVAYDTVLAYKGFGVQGAMSVGSGADRTTTFSGPVSLNRGASVPTAVSYEFASPSYDWGYLDIPAPYALCALTLHWNLNNDQAVCNVYPVGNGNWQMSGWNAQCRATCILAHL